VRSPFHSETEAFRFVLLLTLFLLPIVVAAAIGPTWLALVVLAVAVGAVATRMSQLHLRNGRSLEPPLKSAPPHRGSVAERRVLVVANDTLGEEALLSEIKRLASTPRTHVLVLVPGIVSPGARLSGNVDPALDQARARLEAALDGIGDELDIAGEVTATDPLEAIEDAFATFAADEVIISTRSTRAGGLEPSLGGQVRERFAVPVHHLIIDPGSGASQPDQAAEERYRREFDRAVAAWKRKVGLVGLAGVGILAALVMSGVALIQSGQSAGAGTGQFVVAGAVATKVVDVSVIPSSKLGPDGKKHDAYTTTDFAVKAGQLLKLRIDNHDSQPHSFVSFAAGVNMVILPGTHTYTLVLYRTGRFRWLCVTPCDSGANGWAMQHPGYMSGYITVT
jgi:hypothetical protein